jgi:hypothetical protein
VHLATLQGVMVLQECTVCRTAIAEYLSVCLNESHYGKCRSEIFEVSCIVVGKREISFVHIHEQIKGRLKPEVRNFLLSVFGDV